MLFSLHRFLWALTESSDGFFKTTDRLLPLYEVLLKLSSDLLVRSQLSVFVLHCALQLLDLPLPGY